MSTVSGPQELIPSSSETRSQIWHSHTSLFCPERTYQVTTQSLQDLKAIFGGGDVCTQKVTVWTFPSTATRPVENQVVLQQLVKLGK